MMGIPGIFGKTEPSDAQVAAAITRYMAGLQPSEAARIVGAIGLTSDLVRSMVESVKGDRYVEITFANGDMAVISNRATAHKAGPGW